VDAVSPVGSRPALRWLVPAAAAAVVIGGGAAAGTIVASADPSLPERSAAQLLVDIQNAKVDGFSGTVVQRADLGLPAISGLSGEATGGIDLMKIVTGNNTARVWYAGQDQARVALMTTLGQTDIIRNGTDVWVWRSSENTATHLKLPAGSAGSGRVATPTELPSTPQDAAAMALAAIDPTTAVSTSGAAKVAGRSAYELILSPRDSASLVGQVRMAIDAKQHVPLRVEVYAKNTNNAAFSVTFDQISFTKPDAQQFAFNPPPGTKVETPQDDAKQKAGGAKADGKAQSLDKAEAVDKAKAELEKARAQAAKPGVAVQDGEPTVIGAGWTSVVVVKSSAKDVAEAGKSGSMVASVLNSLPKVTGSWGSGRLLTSNLFSALLTDDGRLLAGAVAPEKLYELAATAGK
jgi:outer membrane lipoprotein-sorting protein